MDSSILHLPFGGNSSQQSPIAVKATGDHVQSINEEVEQVMVVMDDNLKQMNERGVQLEALERSTKKLEEEAKTFKDTSTKVRKHMWWKNMKMNIIIGCVVIVVLCAIIVPVALKFSP